MLKAYVVQERPFDWQEGNEQVLVYANTGREAIKIGCKFIEYERFTELRAQRCKAADGYNKKPTSPTALRLEDDIELFRELGWQYEGDESCADCGLYTMDGRFPVCQDCEFCTDCGHEEECEHKQPAEQAEGGQQG